MLALWLRDMISGKLLDAAARNHARQLANDTSFSSRRNACELLTNLRRDPGPKVRLGVTAWGEPVVVPLVELVHAFGLTTGSPGAGKTMLATIILEAILRLLPRECSVGFGVVDPKGELFDRALYLVAKRLDELAEPERTQLIERLTIIDLSSSKAITPYNILERWPQTDRDFFLNSRLETLRELLPARDKLSLRGSAMLAPSLSLLIEQHRPVTEIPHLLSDDHYRLRLAANSKDSSLRHYFQHQFSQESKQTVAALRVRMETLFASEGVKLALSGSTAPDFRRLQDEGGVTLINLSGPTITRGVRLLLQGLILSDIRQSIFARPNDPPVTYLWFADEAQNYFLTRQQQSDLSDILTMGRSFGSFFYLLCQNLSAAVSDPGIFEILHTIVRWTMTFRGTPRDAQFLRGALPVTGRLAKPSTNPFQVPDFYTIEQERALALEGVRRLQDRTGYLWLKARSAAAVRLHVANLPLPQGNAFRDVVDAAREQPNLGHRVSRPEYLQQVTTRDRDGIEVQREESLRKRLEETYARQEALWRG